MCQLKAGTEWELQFKHFYKKKSPKTSVTGVSIWHGSEVTDWEIPAGEVPTLAGFGCQWCIA